MRTGQGLIRHGVVSRYFCETIVLKHLYTSFRFVAHPFIHARLRAQRTWDGRALAATLERDSQAGHLSPEGRRGDVQDFGGAFPAPVAFTQSSLDGRALGSVNDVG